MPQRCDAWSLWPAIRQCTRWTSLAALQSSMPSSGASSLCTFQVAWSTDQQEFSVAIPIAALLKTPDASSGGRWRASGSQHSSWEPVLSAVAQVIGVSCILGGLHDDTHGRNILLD